LAPFFSVFFIISFQYSSSFFFLPLRVPSLESGVCIVVVKKRILHFEFFFFGACVSFCSHLEGEDEHVALDAKQGNNPTSNKKKEEIPTLTHPYRAPTALCFSQASCMPFFFHVRLVQHQLQQLFAPRAFLMVLCQYETISNFEWCNTVLLLSLLPCLLLRRASSVEAIR
jgi:hypothetical protein